MQIIVNCGIVEIIYLQKLQTRRRISVNALLKLEFCNQT